MDNGILPGTLQWWHIIVSIFALVFTMTTSSFSKAFARWADKLEHMSTSLNARLDKMENDAKYRLDRLDASFAETERKLHILIVEWERRITWIEAMMERKYKYSRGGGDE